MALNIFRNTISPSDRDFSKQQFQEAQRQIESVNQEARRQQHEGRQGFFNPSALRRTTRQGMVVRQKELSKLRTRLNKFKKERLTPLQERSARFKRFSNLPTPKEEDRRIDILFSQAQKIIAKGVSTKTLRGDLFRVVRHIRKFGGDSPSAFKSANPVQKVSISRNVSTPKNSFKGSQIILPDQLFGRSQNRTSQSVPKNNRSRITLSKIPQNQSRTSQFKRKAKSLFGY